MVRYLLYRAKYKLIFNKINRNNRIENNSNLYSVKFDVKGSGNLIQIGKDCNLRNLQIYIRGDGHKLIIEDKVSIKLGVISLEDDHSEIIISKDTTIESALISCTESDKKIFIGEDCMFSEQVQIRTGDSHSVYRLDNNEIINSAKDIFIGEHVWIGSKASILKGVKIGKNSIIGLGSVVTKDVPENCIFAGVPGKVINNNIGWSRQRLTHPHIDEIIDNNS